MTNVVFSLNNCLSNTFYSKVFVTPMNSPMVYSGSVIVSDTVNFILTAQNPSNTLSLVPNSYLIRAIGQSVNNEFYIIVPELNGGSINASTIITGSVPINTLLTMSFAVSSSYANTASYANTSSYIIGGGLITGNTYTITSSWSNKAISSSYALTASFAPSSYTLPSSITASFSGSLTGSVLGTSSYSNTSSVSVSASYAPSSYVLPTNITASFTGSLTGSVLGTSSWSNNSTSASYSLSGSFVTSASYAPLVLPTTINTTSSWSNNSLTASYVSSSNIKGNIISASYALTSSFATSASYAPNTGGTSLTTGSTYPITSSWSLSSSYIDAGNVNGTVVSASYALSASYAPPVAGGALGGSGTSNYIPVWIDALDFGDSNIYTDGTNTAFNDTAFDGTAPEMLRVRGATYNIISGYANLNSYVQLNVKNVNSGANASADIVATNNSGNEFGNYIDMGINILLCPELLAS